MIRSTLSFATLAITAALVAAPAAAHQPRVGPHGGALVDAGGTHHAELVVDGTDKVIVHLSDLKDAGVSSKGFKADAILVIDGKPVRFTLEPAEPSHFVGTAPVKVSKGVKGAIRITGPDGATSQAKF
ncbi:hypothetical protein [Pinisolibacter sp.]|uniref:hypothetical protein n=1 Tax=Pinisolibacter sp. TaxID=2172024 RepID=UPI002FDE4F4C